MHVDGVFNLGLLPLSPADTFAMQAADAVVRCGLAAAAARIFRAVPSTPTASTGRLRQCQASSPMRSEAGHIPMAVMSTDGGGERSLANTTLHGASSVTLQALMSAAAAALGLRPRHVPAQAAVAPASTPPDGISTRTTREASTDEDDGESSSRLSTAQTEIPVVDMDVETMSDVPKRCSSRAMPSRQERQERQLHVEPVSTKGKGRAATAGLGGGSRHRQLRSAELWSVSETRRLSRFLSRCDGGIPTSTDTWERWSRYYFPGRTAQAVKSKAMKLVATELNLATKHP